MRAIAIAILIGLQLLAAAVAAAAPMNLANPQPRWVAMRLETTRPYARDRHYGEPVAAWLEGGPAPGQVSVRIPAASVERQLLGEQQPVPGSFDDFVWIFDTKTGHVLSARLSGRVVQQVRLGIVSAPIEVQIAAELTTLQPGGYRSPRRWMGREVVRYCASPAPDCHRVDPVVYDSTRGYVNAIGGVRASWRGVQMTAFASLGQARFAEWPAGLGEPAGPAVSP